MSARVPAIVALVGLFALLVCTLFVRVAIHRRRTGSSGIKLHGLGTTAGRASALIFASPCLSVAACVVDLALPLPHLIVVAPAARVAVGVLGWAMGFALMWLAQEQMRESWRAGVDETERTDLVTGGLFRVVRNPIFSGWLLVAAACFVLVPNVLSIFAFVLLLAGIEIQVRAVEEPYLARVHGETYRRYTSDVGRLVPTLGRR